MCEPQQSEAKDWHWSSVEELFRLDPAAPRGRYDDQIEILLDRARGIVSLLETDGESLEGFQSGHKAVIAAIYQVDWLIAQAEQLVKLSNRSPAS